MVLCASDCMKDPDDVLALRSQWLERAITRLGRKLPRLPRNQRQQRVYAHGGSICFMKGREFLRAALEHTFDGMRGFRRACYRK